MKIAFDSQIFVHQRYGGVSRYICELARNIAFVEDVSIIAPMNVNAYINDLPPSIVTAFNSPLKSERFRFLNRALGLILSDPLLRISNPDLIHETYYFAAPLGSGRAKRVLTVYDMIHEKLPESGRMNNAMAVAKSRAIARADHVICISENTRQDVLDYFNLPPASVTVIHLAVDQRKGAHVMSRSPNDFTDRPYLLYVGYRNGYKNFAGLLRAYACSQWLKTTFNLVCFGGGGFTAQEYALMDGLMLDRSSIKQVNGTDQELMYTYSCASAFVFPSFYEGFGIPPLEAMANDCPVVCSNTSSIPEVVGNAGRYFDPSKPEEMAEQLVALLQSPSDVEELISEGRRRSAMFTWSACAEKTLKVYRDLV